jgi:hypothetical protein
MRALTTKSARKMVAKRKTYGAGTGRPPKPTRCPKCGARCESARKALGHC